MPRTDFRFDPIVGEIGSFFGQEHYRSLGPSIAARKPVFKAVLLCARLAATSRLGACLLIVAAYLFYPQLRRPTKPGGIFEFGLSVNNERSFCRLNAIMAGDKRWAVEMNEAPVPLALRLSWLSLARLWEASHALCRSRTNNPFVAVQQALGCAAAMLFDAALAAEQPSLVVVANDHSPCCVALREAAQLRGLAVIYIQHAPVNRYFPPLAFDLSILFDEVSRDHYRETATDSAGTNVPSVILSPFSQSLRMPRTSTYPIRIGICLGVVTGRTAVAEVTGQLVRLPQVGAIHVRPHPRSRESEWRLPKLPGISVRPAGESLDSFLADVDIVLVPNSGVCIECLHRGKPTFYLPRADSLADDHYGFVADGILPEFDIAMIGDREMISAPFDAAWRERFSRYDATVRFTPADMERDVRRAVEALLARTGTA